MNQETIKKYNLDLYDKTEISGKYDIPKIYSVEYMPDDLLGFNYVTNTTDKSIGVHFFLDDYQIERIWNRPEFYINKLKDFDCVLTPDFSLYSDMPKIYDDLEHIPFKINWSINAESRNNCNSNCIMGR